MLSRGQPGIEEAFLRRPSQLVEAGGLDAPGRPAVEDLERRAAPEVESPTEHDGCPIKFAGRHERHTAVDELLEATAVDLVIGQGQPIPGRRRLDRRRAECPTDAQHAALDNLRPRSRRLVAPQRIGQPVGTQHVTGVQRQGTQNDLVSPLQRGGRSADMECTEHVDAHQAIVRSSSAPVNGRGTGAIPRRETSDTGVAQDVDDGPRRAATPEGDHDEQDTSDDRGGDCRIDHRNVPTRPAGHRRCRRTGGGVVPTATAVRARQGAARPATIGLLSRYQLPQRAEVIRFVRRQHRGPRPEPGGRRCWFCGWRLRGRCRHRGLGGDGGGRVPRAVER